MASLKLSFVPYASSPAEDQHHNLGNIADDVWKEMLAVTASEIVDGRYYGRMEILIRRPLRKKERDELERRLKLLAKKQPELDPKVIYSD